MCASEYVVDIFSGLYSDREPFWLEILGLTSRTLGADRRIDSWKVQDLPKTSGALPVVKPRTVLYAVLQ